MARSQMHVPGSDPDGLCAAALRGYSDQQRDFADEPDVAGAFDELHPGDGTKASLRPSSRAARTASRSVPS